MDKDGNVDIYLKHGLGNLAAHDFRADKENLKLTMLIESIRLLKGRNRLYLGKIPLPTA